MDTKLAAQLKKIAKLPHDKNAFENPSVWITEYPEVERSIVEQAASAGFRLPDSQKSGLAVRARKFELQTHARSVEEHTDDVERGVYFGLLPVSRRRRVHTSHESGTWLNFQLGRKRLQRRMGVGELIVFNPRAPHSLVYYGEETTFMLFVLVRDRRSKLLDLTN